MPKQNTKMSFSGEDASGIGCAYTFSGFHAKLNYCKCPGFILGARFILQKEQCCVEGELRKTSEIKKYWCLLWLLPLKKVSCRWELSTRSGEKADERVEGKGEKELGAWKPLR